MVHPGKRSPGARTSRKDSERTRAPGRRSVQRASATMVALVWCLAGAALPACDDPAVQPAADASPRPDSNNGPVTYRAIGIPGGLDRILITRADPPRDLCAGLRLVWPDSDDTFGIDLPSGWGVEFTYLYEGAATCHEDVILPVGAVPASRGSGAITWDGASEVLPAVLSIDVTLIFLSPMPWVPDRLDFAATDLSVSY